MQSLLHQITTSPNILPPLIVLGGGLLSCFAGYRLFKVVLGVYGFILGASLASEFVAPGNQPMLLVAALVGGLVGAMLLVALYFLGVGMVGAAAGAFLAQTVSSQLGYTPNLLVMLLFAAVGVVLALLFQRVVITVVTAFGGAWTAIVGAAALMGLRVAARAHLSPWRLYPFNPPPGQRWLVPIAAILGIIGVIVQFSNPARMRR